MPPCVSLRPLPSYETFVHGCYGVGPVFVRGLATIASRPRSTAPLHLQSLRIVLRGDIAATCTLPTQMLETVTCTRLLFERVVHVFRDPYVLAAGQTLDIPFEFEWPDAHASVSSAVPRLHPASGRVVGRAHQMYPYNAAIRYEVAVEYVETRLVDKVYAALFGAPPDAIAAAAAAQRVPTRVAASLHPFDVYDPRTVPALLLPQPRHWRSAPDAEPAEYDVELEGTTFGPGDVLHFGYRIAVAPMARGGGGGGGGSGRDAGTPRPPVRIRRVVFVLREHHLVGEANGESVGRYPRRARGSRELLRWQQEEGPVVPPLDGRRGAGAADARAAGRGGPPAEAVELAEMAGTPSRRPSPRLPSAPRDAAKRAAAQARPSWGWGSGGYSWRQSGSGGGVYAETDVALHIPDRDAFVPTTARPGDASLLSLPLRGPMPALVDVKHSVQITLHFDHADPVVLECGVTLTSVSRSDCLALLDADPERVPPLDYDRIVGSAGWVPAYARHDPRCPPPSYLPHGRMAARVPWRALLDREAREAREARTASDAARAREAREAAGSIPGGVPPQTRHVATPASPRPSGPAATIVSPVQMSKGPPSPPVAPSPASSVSSSSSSSTIASSVRLPTRQQIRLALRRKRQPLGEGAVSDSDSDTCDSDPYLLSSSCASSQSSLYFL
ncbi:hypothetical protein CXG81DRAFT_19787 [Caulochytrium protostelioides]|uniref:Uncharacterized protein n=1 Tax=Caulochytrium protostelioides TaxID=1555241 RepID=A0A4P9X596_9FUNG|nr:hypothetical protein CXG81DRAFT_19787 [Caulochytrium protostelioides]|eukprot:RKP00231.1 hypothetical protein CXG81DRAFT_19787 [Caulochytrium protostelioides]